MPILSPLTFIHYWSLIDSILFTARLTAQPGIHDMPMYLDHGWWRRQRGPHTQQCMNKFVSSDRLCGLSNAPCHGDVATRRGCWPGCSLVAFAHLTQDYMECICRYSISACSNIFDIVVCAYHGTCSPSNALSNIHVIVLQGHRLGRSQTAFVHATQDNVCHSSTFQRCLV